MMVDDPVKSPAHYCDGGIETKDYIRSKLTKNALKYISRAGKKAGNSAAQDIDKAIVYLGWARDRAADDN